MLYRRSLLVIHFKYSSVYTSIPNSQYIPPPHPFLIGSFMQGFLPFACSEPLGWGSPLLWSPECLRAHCPHAHFLVLMPGASLGGNSPILGTKPDRGF